MAPLSKIRRGFCTISPKATTGKGILPNKMDKFLGQICWVEEFDSEGGVLALSSDGNALGMFDKEDVINSFECEKYGNFILPPNMSELDKMLYVTKLMNRIGGYGSIVKNMVIVNSLNKGVYNDDFLFAIEKENAHRKEWEKQKQEANNKPD